ncbi:MAG: DNA mismatch repair endonuclease MutL [Muribaculaceae bacterium]|nr:DNA mismatch repair endonuclease MutL [Muribaculaceae bacterium]
MDVIKLLPDSVANQIAAGEVIQRPASVVKELVENAIDAGATEITIIIKDAGRTLIQVVDNGCGMSATDARLAFERHSTSKIRQADDLFALHTMGFRGEALASICAVAQVDLRTMRRDDPVGTRIMISGSKVESQLPEACAPGSNMMVKNLFFNVPARRKFLKKDSVEMSNIIHEFERLALVNCAVEMTLIHNDVTLFSLPKANLKRRIVALFGKSLDSQLIPVETDTAMVRIHGFVVKPEHCRKRGALQFLFVNGRNMRHPYFHKAIAQCYEDLVPADYQPVYFIDFVVDPATIDVNIHPTKNEIKFEQEQSIRQILYAAVKETLGRFNATPAMNFDEADPFLDVPAADPTPAAGRDFPAAPHTSADPSYNPFRQQSSGFTPSAQNWEELYRNFAAESQSAISGINESQQAESSLLDSLPDLTEADVAAEITGTDGTPQADIIAVGNRYAAMPDARGLRVVDLHRAHTAILFDRFSKPEATFASQRLIFPEQFAIDPADQPLVEEIEPELTRLGFDIAPLGQGVWSINAVPSAADGQNPGSLLSDMVRAVADGSADNAAEPLRQRLAMALASSAAFRADRQLSAKEIHHLLSELMALPLPGYTPSGAPVFTILTPADMARLL